MATTSYLLTGSTLMSTHLMIRQSPLLHSSLQWRNTPPSFNPGFTPLSSSNPFKLSLKCTANPPLNPISESDIRHEDPAKSILDAILNAVKELKTPAVTLVLMAALLMSDPLSAWAASGGRMGGRSSSSSSRSSSSRSSSSGSSSSRSSSSRSSSSRSSSSPSSSSWSYSSSSSSHSSSPSSESKIEFDLAKFFKFMAAMVGIVIATVCSCWLFSEGARAIQETTTVLKLQVGLLGSARSIQRDLNKIAKTTNASTPDGLAHILTETTVALLRHPEYFTSAFSSRDVKTSFEASEQRFNELSIEERGKLDEETLVNVNNTRRQRPTTNKGDGSTNEYIVVTILVEAAGYHKLPTINGCTDLKHALQKLGSVIAGQIRAVEVIWTPQDENDTLSEKEVAEDYPLLKPIS